MELILCTACVGIAVFAAISAANEYLKRRRLLGEVEVSKHKSKFLLQDIAAALGRFASNASGLPFISAIESRTSKQLLSADLGGKDLACGFILVEIIAFLLGAYLVSVLFSEHRIIAAVVGGASACLVLELWLALKIRARRESIQRDLPFALDMMTLCVEAGLDLAQAMRRVGERLRDGPLANELRLVDSAFRTGASRSEALSRMTRPGGDPALSSLATLLIQADRMGSGVGPILRGSSARLARERFLRAERRGAYASQKALLPLVLCIMPATFVVVFGPIAVRLITGGVEALF
jgi:pilus assembly protein TadC